MVHFFITEEFLFSEDHTHWQKHIIYKCTYKYTKCIIHKFLVTKFRNKRSYRHAIQHFCVTYYISFRRDWISGPLWKKTINFHGELWAYLQRFKYCVCSRVEVTASSLVPTAQELAVMRNRVQTQLSLRENGRSFSGTERTEQSFKQLRNPLSWIKSAVRLRPSCRNSRKQQVAHKPLFSLLFYLACFIFLFLFKKSITLVLIKIKYCFQKFKVFMFFWSSSP